MLRPYTFVNTDHQKLHNFVISFFNRIETETGDFDENFFEVEFLPVVKRHRKILKQSFIDIYNELKKWEQVDRTQLCEAIRESNEIERICAGEIRPKLISRSATGLHKKIRTLFLNLYSSVLNGDIVAEELHITVREHFEVFRKANDDITLCPICGITELKTEHDNTRDQYDHYLPESIYPLSSINFHNLVPTCKDCNSTDVKGNKDIVNDVGCPLFYPYDAANTGIEIDFTIIKDDSDITKVEWGLNVTSKDGKNHEVDSWKEIYDIENRYINYTKGRIIKWYNAYWEYTKKLSLAGLDSSQKSAVYIAVLESNNDNFLDVVKFPAFKEFLEASPLARAQQEAALYT